VIGVQGAMPIFFLETQSISMRCQFQTIKTPKEMVQEKTPGEQTFQN
jgi:hypothetical protein